MFKKKRKENAVILFADIVQSSAVYKKAGDKAGQRYIAACIAALSNAAVESGGTIIKTIGDEVMCLFSDSTNAITAAVAMHQVLDRDRQGERWGLQSPNLYAGMHKGEVVFKKNDVFGQTVNIAAHLVKLAKPRQILVTGKLFDELADTPHAAALHFLYATPVKGSGNVDLYEYLWEIQDATVICNKIDNIPYGQADARLKLQCGNQTVLIDKNNPCITIGRQQHNQLTINDANASRTHARIEYRHGKLFLIDQSSNGTFLEYTDGKTFTLQNEETALNGKGRISLGRNFSTNPPEVIHFTCAPRE